MKVKDEVKDLTPQEQAAQALAYTLIPATNRTRASGKVGGGEKPKRSKMQSQKSHERRKRRSSGTSGA